MTRPGEEIAVDKPRLRIAWIASAYGFGTDLAYYRQILAEFVRRYPDTTVHVEAGYPVELYPELPLKPDFSFHIRETQRTISGVPYVGRRRLPSVGTLRSILKDPARVFVIIEFTPVALLGWLVGKLRRRRLVLLVECDPRFRGAQPSAFVDLVKRIVGSSVDAVLTSNEHGRRYVIEQLHLPARKVLVGPYLTSDPGVESELSARFDGRVQLLFLNTLSRRKGILELLVALQRLPQDVADQWTLTVVGSGEEEHSVRKIVEDGGLQQRVVFHDRVPHSEVSRFYGKADVVVCPTLGDYRSLAGIEAVNAGRGVIVSSQDGATAEIVEHAPAAWVIDPRSADQFAGVLTDLLRDRVKLASRLKSAMTPPAAFSIETVGDNLQRAVDRATA